MFVQSGILRPVNDGDDRWRIKEFAARVGVQEPTLRAWERRYDLLSPERSAGGYRLYSGADERRVRAMQAHMARGIAAAQAAALAIAEPAGELAPPADPQALLAELLAAAEAFEAMRFDVGLGAAFASGRVTGIRTIVLPLLVEVGERWERGRLTVGHEHFVSHLVERRLLTLAAGWESGDGPRALLACAPGERHTLGLLCFGLVLADRGWRIGYLGADTPVADVARAAASLTPEVVVLCALDERHLRAADGAIAALGRRHRTILAGRGASAEVAARLGVERAEGDPASTAEALAAAHGAAPA